MKRFIVLATAVATAPLSADEVPLEHVLVSVPLHKKAAETALPVTVLTGDELQRAATQTIGETLSNTAGITNASYGPAVGQPVIRGQQGPRVTVLQNGTGIADASSVSPDHANATEPLLADSIEVLRGPSTLLYGGGAIGGVVNVIDNRIPTSVPEEVSGAVEYRFDSASDMNVGVARLDGGAGNFAYHVDGVYRDWNDLEIPGTAVRDPEDEDENGGDGHISNTDGDSYSVTGGGAYHFDTGFFGLAVNHLEDDYGIPGHGHEHEEEDEEHEDEEEHEHEEEEEEEGGVRIDLEQTRYDGNLHLHDLGFVDVVRGFLTYTDYQHEEIEGSGEVGTRFENDTWESRLEAVHKEVGNFHGVFGLQYNVGEFSTVGEEAYIPKTDSEEIGVFLVEDYHAGDLLFEVGLRYDYVDRDPSGSAQGEDFDAYSVSGSALWEFSDNVQFGLSLSRAERAPAVEELYSNAEATSPDELVEHVATGAIEVGDPDLDTEVSNNADLSLRFEEDLDYLEANIFYNDFEDYITLINTGEEIDEVPVLEYRQEGAEFWGLELDTEFTLANFGESRFALGLFGDYVRGELDSGGDVPRLPPTRFGGRLSLGEDAWYVWTSLLWADDQDRPGDNEEETEGYTRWDIGGEYRLPIADGQVLLSLEGRNLADEEIRLSTSFLRDEAPEAGRSVVATVRYSF
ncbi:MAG: TonB-dependent receptor [Pseudomonadota bacterium]